MPRGIAASSVTAFECDQPPCGYHLWFGQCEPRRANQHLQARDDRLEQIEVQRTGPVDLATNELSLEPCELVGELSIGGADTGSDATGRIQALVSAQQIGVIAKPERTV